MYIYIICGIVIIVFVISYFSIDKTEHSGFDELPFLDFSYSTSVADACGLVDAYFAKNYSPNDREAFTFYLLCLLSRHKLSKLYRLYFYKIYSIAQSDYGLNVDASYLSRYRVVSCIYKNKPNFYISLKHTDCLNYEEYICIYNFVVHHVNHNVLPDHMTLQDFCLLLSFLCRSRFAGGLGHDKVDGINFVFLTQLFVMISDNIRGSQVLNGISSDAFTAKEFFHLKARYKAELQSFYDLNKLGYSVSKHQFAPKKKLEELYFRKKKKQTLF